MQTVLSEVFPLTVLGPHNGAVGPEFAPADNFLSANCQHTFGSHPVLDPVKQANKEIHVYQLLFDARGL